MSDSVKEIIVTAEVSTFDLVTQGVGRVTLAEEPTVEKGSVNAVTHRAVVYQSTELSEFGIFAPGSKFKITITKL